MSLNVVALFLVAGGLTLIALITALVMWATRPRSPLDDNQSRSPVDQRRRGARLDQWDR